MPRAEDLVDEARLGDLRGSDRAAQPVVALQHADAPAALRQQGPGGQRVDPAADDDSVVARHLARLPNAQEALDRTAGIRDRLAELADRDPGPSAHPRATIDR